MPLDNQTAPKPASADRPATNEAALPLLVGATAMKSWLQIGAETARFAADRQQETLKTLHALRSCANLAEMRDVQFMAFKTAQDQYAAQTQRMMNMAGRAAMSGPIPMPGSKLMGYDDVPV